MFTVTCGRTVSVSLDLSVHSREQRLSEFHGTLLYHQKVPVCGSSTSQKYRNFGVVEYLHLQQELSVFFFFFILLQWYDDQVHAAVMHGYMANN